MPPAIPPPLPPPPSCWGENRAKFSDVVARNQDTVSIFGNASNTQKIQAKLSEVASTSSNTNNSPTQTKSPENRQTDIRDEKSNLGELKLNPKFTVAENLSFEKENKSPVNQGVLLKPSSNSCHTNSFFINTFAEPQVWDTKFGFLFDSSTFEYSNPILLSFTVRTRVGTVRIIGDGRTAGRT